MTIRIGVIGTGAIGRDHMRRLSRVLPGAAVVAASDISAPAAHDALHGLGLEGHVFDDGEALAASPEVDAVLVTSFGATHARYVLAAIAAGKPVFCEKPLATTAADCRRIVDAEIAHGSRLVQVGFMRRYDPGYRQLRDVVRSGRIGEPLMLHCAHRNPAVPATYTTDMAIHDTLVHELDVLRWLVDDDYRSIQVVFPRATSRTHPELRDPQIALIETNRGVRIDVEIFVNCAYGYDIQCEVVGERGTARLPEPPDVSVRLDAQHATPVLVDWKDRFLSAYDHELADFLRGCRERDIGGPSAWDGFAAAIASDAGVAAQKEAGPIPIALPDRPGFYAA
ncbi:MAG: Gfo/Idh/MocA family oxidoreductase [Gluconacetobacter diazotrophicus]|nr:Gfo/Idh/MocA family oxidoreductase [Gluconacetobacter diazotrophicus]